ncbi:MAG: hypothetical protein HYW49_04390 [Deltaproteobacteria bacterium]|nr:hypothetical protein [Deltaproteobacteria bacterium]
MSVSKSLLFGALVIAALPPSVNAKTQKAVGFGPVFYSGVAASALVPTYAFDFSFSANNRIARSFYFTNRFNFGFLTGDDFAGRGAYYGIAGSYTFGPRLNLGKDRVIPYIEAGPVIGMFAAQLSSPAATDSKNQTAVKYGYGLGIGFDSLSGEEKGWGMEVSYFHFLTSPSLFEFPAKSLTATGIKLEFRFLLKEK